MKLRYKNSSSYTIEKDLQIILVAIKLQHNNHYRS